MTTKDEQENKNTATAQQATVNDYVHPMSIEDFRRNGYEMIDWICNYFQNNESYPVMSQVKPGYLHDSLPSVPPEEGEPFDGIVNDVNNKILPGITHWQHPNYFAYFSANASLPSLLGDMLSSTFNVIGFNWIASPAATELETVVLDWLAHALQLPEFYFSKGKGGGCIQGTASEAVIVCLLAAKARALEAYLNMHNIHSQSMSNEEKILRSKLIDQFQSKIVVYTSDQAHSSIKKACMIVGIQDERCRIIESNERFEFDPTRLEEAIASDIEKSLIPIFVAVTKGTTSSTAFDDLTQIGPICEKFNNQSDHIKIWLHVDSAFAGSAFICPEYRQQYLQGIEYSNSFNFNPHKWLLTNFDCSALWIRDRKYLLDALSITPEYLRNKATESGLVIDYRDWQIPLGRRFRALKLWFVLRSYGIKGLQGFIRHHIQLAELFEQWVHSSDLFELVVPRTISLICFRIKPEIVKNRTKGQKTPNELNALLLDRVNETGKIFIVHTVLKGIYTLRMAICGTNTQERNIRMAWQVLNEEAEKLLREYE
jgi:aromatic-L-amino-acid decarboxylase